MNSSTGAKPRFRFLQLNELHFQGPENTFKNYERANERAAWIFEALRSGDHFPPPDFVLALGDMVNGPELEAIKGDLAALLEMIEPLPCPMYVLPGNHDIGKREGDPKWEQPFLDAFGLDQCNYEFEHDGLRFVMLNNAGTTHCEEPVYRDRADWLRGVLQAENDKPIILCCHMPLLPMREESVLIESCDFATWRTQEPEVLELVRQYKDKIVAVLSGHLHITSLQQDAGVWHVDIAGLASYPSDVAMYSVYDDRIEVEVIQTPQELLVPTTTIHGRTRHQHDYVDRLHPTHDEYLMGLPHERRFSIPLSKGGV